LVGGPIRVFIEVVVAEAEAGEAVTVVLKLRLYYYWSAIGSNCEAVAIATRSSEPIVLYY
jgi:hypothetical protein